MTWEIVIFSVSSLVLSVAVHKVELPACGLSLHCLLYVVHYEMLFVFVMYVIFMPYTDSRQRLCHHKLHHPDIQSKQKILYTEWAGLKLDMVSKCQGQSKPITSHHDDVMTGKYAKTNGNIHFVDLTVQMVHIIFHVINPACQTDYNHCKTTWKVCIWPPRNISFPS